MATDQTSLVLLPGIDGTDVFFRPLVAALPPWISCRVVTYPPRGGSEYVDLLPRVEASARGAGDFFVLGWSFSGPLALMLAAREPARTRGVILCSSFVRPPLAAAPWLRLAASAPSIALVRLARRVPARLLGRGSTPLARARAMTWSQVPSRAVAERARSILAVDARVALRECAAPILYLAASRDTVVPRRNADDVVRERPSTQVTTIAGTHLALFTNAVAAAERIVDFIEACGRAARSRGPAETEVSP